MLTSFKVDEKPVKRKMLHCASCKRQTIHNLAAQYVGLWDDPYNQEGGGQRYAILRCGGCDTVCYETTSWDTANYEHDEDGEIYHPEVSVQYPAPVSAHFNFNTESTPSELDDILGEMLYALAGSKTILATIGLRLAIEFIANDTKCAGKNLADKIDAFEARGDIGEDQKKLLHSIRKKGNAGAHQAKGMSANELIAGMSIVEGLLEKLYNGPARLEATIKRAKRFLDDSEK